MARLKQVEVLRQRISEVTGMPIGDIDAQNSRELHEIASALGLRIDAAEKECKQSSSSQPQQQTYASMLKQGFSTLQAGVSLVKATQPQHKEADVEARRGLKPDELSTEEESVELQRAKADVKRLRSALVYTRNASDGGDKARKALKEAEKKVEALMMGSTPHKSSEAASGITLEEEASPPSSAIQLNHKKKLEEHETTIVEAASKKMKLEVDAKAKEMKRLMLEKEKAVENLEKISSELGAVQKLIGKDRGFLKQHEEEDLVDQKRIEALNLEINVLLQKSEERQALIRGRQLTQRSREEKGARLEGRLEEVKLLIDEVDKKIADLPTAPVYSQEMLDILKKQITGKRRELECPVCLEESSPPIFTCAAQHLVCGNCRPSLKECVVCRVPYQEMSRHRYAERDHKELVELCSRQTALGQKLFSREEGEDEEQPVEGGVTGMVSELREELNEEDESPADFTSQVPPPRAAPILAQGDLSDYWSFKPTSAGNRLRVELLKEEKDRKEREKEENERKRKRSKGQNKALAAFMKTVDPANQTKEWGERSLRFDQACPFCNRCFSASSLQGHVACCPADKTES